MRTGEEPILLDECPEFVSGQFQLYYSHTFYCRNCSRRDVKWIRKGTLIATIEFDCSNCGCKVKEL